MKRYKVIKSIIHELQSEEIHELVGLAMHKERPVSRAFYLVEEAQKIGRWRSLDFQSIFEVRNQRIEREAYSFNHKVASITPKQRLPILEYLLTQQDYSVEQIVWDEHKYVYALRRIALSMQQYLVKDDTWQDSLSMGIQLLKSLDDNAKTEYDAHMSPLLDGMLDYKELWEDYTNTYHNTLLDKESEYDSKSQDILERIRARRQRERRSSKRTVHDIPVGPASSAPEEKKSIIYRINERHVVTPFQQTESTDGRWTPCNRVNIPQFEEKAVEGMTTLDKNMADLMAKYPEDSHLKQGNPALLEILKGKERLYEANQPTQKVEIQSTSIGIRVKKMEFDDRVLRSTVWGLSIGFDKPITLLEGQTTYVHKPCDGVRELCTIPSQLVSALIQLKGLEPLPLETSDCIVQLVKELSDLDVETDIIPTKSAAHLVQKIEASNYMVVQFNPKNEGFQCRVLARPSMDGKEVFAPNKGPEVCLQLHNNHQVVLIKRQMKAESDLMNTLKERIQELEGYNIDDSNFFLPSNDACLGMLDTLHKSKEKVVIEWPRGGVMGHPIQVQASDVSIKTKSLRKWFEVQVSLQVDDEVLPLEDMIELIRTQSSKEYIQVDDTKFLSITNELREHLVSLDSMLQNKGSKKIVSTFSAPALKHYEESGMQLSKCTRLRQMLSRIKEANDIVPQVPSDLHATLRDYQQTGFEWLARLYQWRAGACLADDMGLGKTLQTITLLLAQAEQGPSLIVVPSSVIYNWRDEIQKFAPTLRVSLLNKTTQRDKMIDQAEKGEVVITSYGLVHTNNQAFSEKKWNITVLDEAHAIKNRSSKTSQAVKQIDAEFTLLLTGTPVQNHLAEIWNLFDIAVPSLLGSYKHFVSNYVQTADKEENEVKHQRLKSMLQPFILRRTKAQVAKELPLKTEIDIHVELSDKERTLYEAVRAHALQTLDDGSINMVTALTEINKLRQLSCHPKLVHPNSKVESSKMNRFKEIVEQLCANEHIALVFSQFTRHLTLVKEQLDKMGVSYLYLDGSQSTKHRAQLVEEFNKGETRIFLISLKAGGVGLNLTTADFVIHLDPWWNPAIESQATDRAYRIGQDKPVTVYRMVSANTIEDQIIEMHQEKRSMADTLLEGSSMATQLTPQEMLRLLSPK